LPIGGFLGALPDGPLVAREAELAALDALLNAVGAGTGRLVLLAGEPGVGKTRLAQEVMLAARNRDWLVATGRCYEPQEVVAYFPFREALSAAHAAAPAAVRAELPRRWPEVARLLPESEPEQVLHSATATSVPSGPGAPQRPGPGADPDDQQRLFWQVASFVETLAATRPVALLLDDLHWADSASLAVLQPTFRSLSSRLCRVSRTAVPAERPPARAGARAQRDRGGAVRAGAGTRPDSRLQNTGRASASLADRSVV